MWELKIVLIKIKLYLKERKNNSAYSFLLMLFLLPTKEIKWTDIE